MAWKIGNLCFFVIFFSLFKAFFFDKLLCHRKPSVTNKKQKISSIIIKNMFPIIFHFAFNINSGLSVCPTLPYYTTSHRKSKGRRVTPSHKNLIDLGYNFAVKRNVFKTVLTFSSFCAMGLLAVTFFSIVIPPF